MLQFIFFLLIFLIFFILFLLLIPFHYALEFSYYKNLKFKLLFSFLNLKLNFLILENKLYFSFFTFKKEFITDKSEKVIKEQSSKKKKKKSDFNFPFELINKDNLLHILNFILKILKYLKPDYLKLNLLFSFSDPYYNGLFLAFYYSFRKLSSYQDIKIDISWQEVMFEGEGKIGGKAIPIKIICLFLCFLFSFKSLKILWTLFKAKKRKGD